MSQSKTVRVDLFIDFICPWCAISYQQIKQAAQHLNISLDIHWQPFDITQTQTKAGGSVDEQLNTLQHQFSYLFKLDEVTQSVDSSYARALLNFIPSQQDKQTFVDQVLHYFYVEQGDLSAQQPLLDLVIALGYSQQHILMAIQEASKDIENSAQVNDINELPAIIIDNKLLLQGNSSVGEYEKALAQFI